MTPPSIPANPGPHQNALKHGFDATDHLFLSHLTPYERGIFDDMREALYADYLPDSLVECLIVDRIAIHYCRLFRFYRLEYHTIQVNMATDGSGHSILPHLDRLSRYDTRLSTHLNKLQHALRAAQRSRELSQQISQDKKSTS